MSTFFERTVSQRFRKHVWNVFLKDLLMSNVLVVLLFRTESRTCRFVL